MQLFLREGSLYRRVLAKETDLLAETKGEKELTEFNLI